MNVVDYEMNKLGVTETAGVVVRAETADEARQSSNSDTKFIMDKLDKISSGEVELKTNDQPYWEKSNYVGATEIHYERDIPWAPKDVHWKQEYDKNRPWVFESGEWKIISSGDAQDTKIYYKGKFINGVQNFNIHLGIGDEGTTLNFEVKL